MDNSKQIEILLNIPFPKVLRVPLIGGAVRVGGGGRGSKDMKC